MNVSVIIVNYNTTQLVIDCINSIYEHTKDILFEVIVVDNDSKNRTIEQLNEIFPFVRLVLNDKNSGFGAANNLGNKYAKGKYLFLLNSDTLLLDNAIKQFYDFMEITPEAGVCGGNLLTKDLKPNFSFEHLQPSLLNSIDKLFFRPYQRIKYGKNRCFLHEDKPTIIKGFTSGADYFIIKKLYNKIGGFDEHFFMYYEDVELTNRVHQSKFKSYIIPSVKIIHLDGGSQSKNQSKKNKWMVESLAYYFKKTRKPGAKLAVLLEELYIITTLNIILTVKPYLNKLINR